MGRFFTSYEETFDSVDYLDDFISDIRGFKLSLSHYAVHNINSYIYTEI